MSCPPCVATLKAKSAADEAHYNAKMSAMSAQCDSLENELRTDFGNQLTELVAGIQKQVEEQKDKGLSEMRAVYDDKVCSLSLASSLIHL